jgi:hypothetical protein
LVPCPTLALWRRKQMGNTIRVEDTLWKDICTLDGRRLPVAHVLTYGKCDHKHPALEPSWAPPALLAPCVSSVTGIVIFPSSLSLQFSSFCPSYQYPLLAPVTSICSLYLQPESSFHPSELPPASIASHQFQDKGQGSFTGL